MKRNLLIAAAVVGATGLYMASLYNGAVPREEAIGERIAKEQVELRRRADLLPNVLAATVGAARFERSTFADVAAARASAQGVSRLDPSKIANDPALQKQVVDAQARIGSALAKVSAAVEANPDLKATAQFRDLAEDVRGSENRIGYARAEEQKAFVGYNSYVRRVPRGWFLALMGFHPKPYYQAGDAARDAPRLQVPE